MRHTLLVATCLLCAAPAVIIACGTDSSNDPGPGDVGSSSGNGSSGVTPPGAPPGPPVNPPPAAVGDPCRGVAMPTDQSYVPTGMCASIVAANVGSLRQIAFAPNGDLFGVTLNGQIKHFHDADGDGFFQPSEITSYASTGGNTTNCHIDVAGGFIYAGSANGVKRFPWSATATTGGAGEDVVTGQPNGGHTHHTVHVYDGYLYVHSGSAGNAVVESGTPSGAYDTTRSLIRRFKLDTFTSGTPFAWLSGEIVTQGLRNANGFGRNEITKKIYAVVNGLDGIHYPTAAQDVHIDNPGEQVLEIAAGKKYGYPYCFTAQRIVVSGAPVTPGTQLLNQDFAAGIHDDAWCAANSSPPTTFVQAHSAPLDIAFFDTQPTNNLPEKYRGGAFVALHGSWNRETNQTGYKVVWIPFNADGTSPQPTSTATDTTFPYEIIFGGGSVGTPGIAKDGPWSWSADPYGEATRPAGVAVGPIDGSLYITSDVAGYIYRVGVKH